MTMLQFNHVKISAISVVVPETEINIYDEAKYYGNSIKKIDRMRKMVGFWKRRVADKEDTALDYAYNAAQHLIRDFDIDKKTIDALIFVVQKPDWIGPVNSYFIHHKLGLPQSCISTDIVQGCPGWAFGLYMASHMIESGAHKHVLLLNGDTPSVGIDPSDRNQAPIFGDGGCATLLEFSEENVSSYFRIDTVSEGYDAIINPFLGARSGINLLEDDGFDLFSNLRNERVTLSTGNTQPLLGGYLDGLRVFDFTIKEVPKTINELIDYANIGRDNINILALHQANKQIIQSVGHASGFDLDKVPYDAFENYGNNTMCSIPTTLSLLEDNLRQGYICCCGFGNGLASVATIHDFSTTKFSPIRNFVKPEYSLSRDEYIDYWRKKMQQ